MWEISIIWGFGVALAVYLTAGISGAHLNPAVTIALWLFACFERRKVVPYIVAQMLGGFCAAALVYSMYYNVFLDYDQIHHIVREPKKVYLLPVFSQLIQHHRFLKDKPSLSKSSSELFWFV